MTTGQKIRQYRKEAGMTQEELGKAIGVQKAAINKYETGVVVNLKRSTLMSIAKALNVSPVDLLDDVGSIDVKNEDYAAKLKLSSIYDSLSTYGKNLLLQRAEELLVLHGKKPEDSSAESV